jgi:hypothetical protein
MGTPQEIQRSGGYRPRFERGREEILPNREVDISSVEFRYTNLERDAAAIAAIWGDEDVREHLAGMAPHPSKTTHNLERYRSKFGKDIIIPVREEILKKFSNPNYVIIVAEDKSSSEVIGVVAMNIIMGAGIRSPMIEKLAVLKKARGKGVAKGLVKSATADVFTRKDKEGNYMYSTASAGIILTEGSEVAQRVFRTERYDVRHTAYENCVSWDNEEGRFVDRDTLNIAKFVDKNDFEYRKGLEQYLPKKAPRNGSRIVN